MKKLTKEIVNERLINENRSLRLVGEYINNKIKSLFKCLVCDHEWLTLWNNVLSGCGCPKCSDTKLTKEIVNERLINENRSLRLIGEYINSRTKSLFKCLVCDHEWFCKSDQILNSCSNCPKCSDTKLTKEIVNERLINENRSLRLIGEYIDVMKKSLFKCLVCEYEWLIRPNDVFNGIGCPKCAGTQKLTKEIVNERLINENRSLRLIGEYINNRTKLLFKCLVCDHEWLTKPNSILDCGTGCPNCAKYGFDPTKPAYLYYIKILHDGWYYYKIGITNKTIEERFTKSDLNKIQEVLIYDYYDIGKNAQEKEQLILKEFKEYRYNGEPILKSNGNSEIFVKDIFEEIT